MRFLTLCKVFMLIFPLNTRGKPTGQVLESVGVFPHEYVIKDESLYEHEDPDVLLEYYQDGVQDYGHYDDNDLYEYEEEKKPVKSNYEFAYGVHDDKHGTEYSRKESSDGKGTKGQYQVHLPDGRIQTVIYSADEHGYRAQVLYEGEAVHDEKPHSNSHPYSPAKKLVTEEKPVHQLPDHHEIHPVPVNELHNSGYGPLVHQADAPKLDAVSPTLGDHFASPTPFYDSPHANPPPPLFHGEGNGYNHVTNLPFPPVTPPSAQIGPQSHHRPHPFHTAPLHSQRPHPHPIINPHDGRPPFNNHFHSNGHPGFHSSASSYPHPNPVIKSHSRRKMKTLVDKPLYRRDIDPTSRSSNTFTRSTKYTEDSTSMPFY